MTVTTTGLPSNLLSATLPKHPYPGLRTFEAEEWMIFFGREKMIEDVIARLARQRLVFIHGASGSGKSSLVRAGVLPKLARQHLRHGEAWHTCTMRPSGGPLWNLAQVFAQLEGRSDDSARVDEIARLFDRRGATLASVAGEIAGLAGKRLCILVDQFEELFRFEREISRDEAELFIDLLIGEVDTTNKLNEDEFGPPALPAPTNERHAEVSSSRCAPNFLGNARVSTDLPKP
jgi:energy-coupling factor transporter ATP-binding protein EcfA2